MRAVICMIPLVAIVAATEPAMAQTYNPRYPVCFQSYSIGGDAIDCSFMSLPQCAQTSAGRGGQCLINPFFADDRAGPADRRQLRGY